MRLVAIKVDYYICHTNVEFTCTSVVARGSEYSQFKPKKTRTHQTMFHNRNVLQKVKEYADRKIADPLVNIKIRLNGVSI